MSVDGCLDAPGPRRLVLSGAEDLDRVDGERADCDAIMVGAGTIRRDNPRLLIKSASRRAARLARGLPEHPSRVTLTTTGGLDPAAAFFGGPPVPRLVYCPDPLVPTISSRMNGLAEVTGAGQPVGLGAVLKDLARRGVRRLMVEGGAALGSQFLAAGLVDELALAVAPFFVGDPAAPRFAAPAAYPHGPGHPMTLTEVRQLEGVVLLRYRLHPAGTAGAAGAAGTPETAGGQGVRESLEVAGQRGAQGSLGRPGEGAEASGADRDWLREAITLSLRCPSSRTAFAVGAVLVAADGTVLATGYSRENGPHDHAEEAALAKLPAGAPGLAGATLYSSLEPCRHRASRPRTCAELVLAAGLRRVVIAWREPPVFTGGGGAELLAGAGVTVIEVPDLAGAARAVNARVLGDTMP
jgi:riboflavin-specific deaminase-like protein